MKNRIGQSKATNAPPGIRTGVWLIMLGLLMLCLFVVSLSYRNAIHSAGVSASGSKDAGVEYFEKKIRPVLTERCYKCHSAQAEKLKGGFRLDTREDLLKGGESGPAIVPGALEKSRLVRVIRYYDEHVQSPPKEKLP